MENSVENVESLYRGEELSEGEREKNSKFLLIVAELGLIFAWCCGGNIWETL